MFHLVWWNFIKFNFKLDASSRDCVCVLLVCSHVMFIMILSLWALVYVVKIHALRRIKERMKSELKHTSTQNVAQMEQNRFKNNIAVVCIVYALYMRFGNFISNILGASILLIHLCASLFWLTEPSSNLIKNNFKEWDECVKNVLSLLRRCSTCLFPHLSARAGKNGVQCIHLT